jgi:hypothetical protein
MREAVEGPSPVRAALNKPKKPRPAVAEAQKKKAQLAQKNENS